MLVVVSGLSCPKPDGPWHQGLSVFVVPTATPGFRVARVMDKLGIRLNQNTELVFEDCRIPADNLISGLNDALAYTARFKVSEVARRQPGRIRRRSPRPAPAWRRIP